MQALESESEKKKEVLMSSFAAKKAKAKNDMDIAGTFSQAEIDGALQAIDEEIACALNLLEMDSLQALEDALVQERRREIKELGQDLDPSAELAWLKEQHIQASEILENALNAEQARRKAKLKERMAARRRDKEKAYMAPDGETVLPDKEDELHDALEEINGQELKSLES